VGKVFELDYRTGVLVKQFSLSRTPLLEDFEESPSPATGCTCS
jgi:hypothetical protein